MRKEKIEKVEKIETKAKAIQIEKPVLKEGESIFIIDNTEYRTTLSAKYLKRKPYIIKNPKMLLAFMPGNIEEICVKKNDLVKMGEKLLVLEAMKMKNEILSPFDGKIKQVLVNKNDKVVKSQLLIELQ